MLETDPRSRMATLGRNVLRKVSSVLRNEFSKNASQEGEPDTVKKMPVVERSEPVTLPNGNTAIGIVRDNTLMLVAVTDKGGNVLEMEPEFFNTSLLKLRKEILIPKFE